MEKEQLIELFKKYHEGKCTEEEKALLEDWYLQHNEYEEIKLSPQKIRAIGKKIFRELPGNHHEFIRIGSRLLAAAAIFGVIVTALIHFIDPGKNTESRYVVKDLPPGKNKAVLHLAIGEAIDLSDSKNGTLVAKAGLKIYKNGSGQITYKVSANNDADHNTNSIETPNGGQWKVQLADGTNVWLNAASSLTFPSSFSKLKSRIVTLTGEGYFEVAKDKAHPFIVKSKGQEVEVLGTHFNINTYGNEPFARTTLAEGKIRLSTGKGEEKILLPGQQATLSTNHLIIKKADLKESLAWVNGQFWFNDEDIQSVMRKISRWYDVDIEYKGAPSADGLNGRISRYKNISQVLKALEATQTVHFKMEGRRVIVMK